MPQELRTSAGAVVSPAEGSTVVVSGSFLDQAAAAVTPTAATWTLTTAAGATVNSRADVAITAAETYAIVLTGADLPAGRLRLLVEWTYNSTIGGTAYTGLTGREEITFEVVDLAGA